MEFDLLSRHAGEAYKLLTAVVVPRPIAWVATSSNSGVLNAAPFSSFNLLGSDPPLIALGIGDKSDGQPKDSRRNIEEIGEFVVNLVTHEARQAMNRSAAEFPAEESEVAVIGLETRPSLKVRPPRLALSPVNLECVWRETVAIGHNRIILGEVIHLHIDDAYFDVASGHVATERLDLIARMHGRGWYARTTELFEMPRLTGPAARLKPAD